MTLISPPYSQLHQLIAFAKQTKINVSRCWLFAQHNRFLRTQGQHCGKKESLWASWNGLWYQFKQFHDISMGVFVVWETSVIGTITNLVLHLSVPRPWCRFVDGLMQNIRNSSVLAMELRLSCINPSIYPKQLLQCLGIRNNARHIDWLTHDWCNSIDKALYSCHSVVLNH